MSISSIIVDGYNAIGIHHGDLRKHRDSLIQALIDYRKRSGHDITVVFDGWRGGAGREGRSIVGGVRVIYSGIGEKADAVILRIVASEKRQWIVVTSDRDIAHSVWASGSVPVTSEDFLRALERRRVLHDDAEEDDDAGPVRRGNPRQMSRKEKAIERALSKL